MKSIYLFKHFSLRYRMRRKERFEVHKGDEVCEAARRDEMRRDPPPAMTEETLVSSSIEIQRNTLALRLPLRPDSECFFDGDDAGNRKTSGKLWKPAPENDIESIESEC